MAKTTIKRPSKATPKVSLPEPFTTVPANLEPFTSTLSKASVYITHIDKHPYFFKRRVFAVPVLLNFAILVLLSWRAFVIIPYYFSMVVSTLGYQHNETTINANELSKRALASVIARRAFSFLIDYVLVTIIWKWPVTFFLEFPHNPVSWRWNIGFRDQEVVVRMSRNWSGEDLVTGTKRGGESPFFKTRILTALDGEFMLKTGYVMMNASWDLDFGSMVMATELVDKKTLTLNNLDRKVFVWQPSGTSDGQWIMWDEKNYGKQIFSELTEMDPAEQSEGRQKILQIQDKMREMGKEDLFYRWVELIQYESTRPGGFTKERQMEAGMKVQALFQEHDVDFEEFEKSVGGMQERS
jgi:hypothetical protein